MPSFPIHYELHINLLPSKISWSKSGAIAYAPDTSSVHVTYLACVDGENWDFSPPYKIHPTDANGQTHPITFLSWNPLGTDLTCIDILGNVSIYTTSSTQLGALNCNMSPSLNNSPPDPQEMNSIIGFKWLESEKMCIIANPATLLPTFEQYIKHPGATNNKTNYVAQYPCLKTRQYGPYLPSIPNQTKQACIALTRRGTIRLFTQGISDARYFEVSASIDRDGIVGEQVLFSHASFAGSKDNTLILAAYSSQNESLYIFKLTIEWPALSAAANRNSPNLNKGTSNHLATIQIKRLFRKQIAPQINSSFYLSHLLMLSSALHDTEAESDAEIHLVFSSAKNDSVVQKYDLLTRPVTLHNNFYSLTFRRDSVGGVDQTQTSLIPSEPVHYSKPIINISSLNFDAFICTCFADGTVDMKHRAQYVNAQASNSPITSLMTVGFLFMPLEPVTDMCVSQNLSSALYLDKTGKLCISYMKNPKLMPIPLSKQNPTQIKQSNIVMVVSAIALALRHAASCFTNTCGDDLVIVIKRELTRIESGSPEAAENFLRLILRESYRAISFALDLSKESKVENILVNPSLQRLLSMQLILGTSVGWRRNAMGCMAWSILNLRILTFAFTYTLKAVDQSRQHHSPGQSEIESKAGYFLSMVGICRWCIDLMAYICQELYMSSIESDHYSYFHGKASSVPGAILLGKVPRMLLLYSLRGIRGMEQIAQKLADLEPNAYSGSAHTAVRKLKEISLHFSPVPLDFFERLVADVDNSLNNVYPTLSDRLQVEHDLIFSARVPKDLSGVLSRTVDIFNNHLKPKINVAWLYFYDVSWLGLSELSPEGGGAKPDYSQSDEKSNGFNGRSSDTYISLNLHSTSRRLSLALQRSPSGSEIPGKSTSPFLYQQKKMVGGGQEIDYLRKEEMSKYSVGNGTRCRCTKCGEVSIWYNHKTRPSPYWTIACQKACICGGIWIPLDQQ